METKTQLPLWAVKLARRLLGLTPGRYYVILTIGRDDHRDWTVQPLGKVEN